MKKIMNYVLPTLAFGSLFSFLSVMGLSLVPVCGDKQKEVVAFILECTERSQCIETETGSSSVGDCERTARRTICPSALSILWSKL